MKGTSYTYFTTDNAKSARDLIAILREAKANVPPQLEEMAMYSGGGGRSKSSRPREPAQIADAPQGRYGGGGRGRGGGGGRYGGHQDNGYGGKSDRW